MHHNILGFEHLIEVEHQWVSEESYTSKVYTNKAQDEV